MPKADVTWGEIDGVPALWPTRRVPGPIQASLQFAVGKSSERFSNSGITHLVEHLALEPVGQQAYMYNGMVTPVVTKFVAMGSAEQITGFYRAVTENLGNLSPDRFEKEIKVLAVEGQKLAAGQLGYDLSLRYGAVGPGLVGWPEHGLNGLSFADAADWAERWFVRSNAVLWLSAPPPRKLTLAALGDRRVTTKRKPASLLLDAPTWAPASTSKVSVSFISGQQWGIAPVHPIAEARCVERLRRDAAMTYSVTSTRVRLPGGRLIDYFEADAAAGAHAEVIAGIRAVFDELATAGPTEAELDLWRARLGQFRSAPQAVVGDLDNAAERRVLGLPDITAEESDARLEKLSAREIRKDLAAVAATMLVVGPNDVPAAPDGLAPLGSWSEGQPRGVEYLPLAEREKGKLVVSDDAISWMLDSSHVRTVPWDDAVGVLAWDNGVRTVIGPAGNGVVVTPWNWRSGDDVAAIVDKHIDDGRWLRIGEGSTEYRLKPADPTSVAQVRWIASLVGAFLKHERVDIGLMTDGLLVLRRRGDGKLDDRLTELRTRTVPAMLKAHPTATWMPVDAIEKVTYRRAGVLRARAMRVTKAKVLGSLTVESIGAPPMTFDLVTASQVSNALSEFPKVLGKRFRSG